MCITTALIPSYCPDETLVHLVKELEEHNVHCVAVNDGSSKEYDHIFDQLPKSTVVLKHETNKGKGAALKTGMKYIHQNIRDGVVVTCDGDGQHLIKDILKIAEEAHHNHEVLVLGVRDFHEEGIPARSRYGNQLTEKVFQIFTGVHISDTQTGLRAFHSSLIPEFLSVEGERYEYEMNQLLFCTRTGIDMVEIPITTVYEGNNEVSHFHVFRDSFRIYAQILKFSLSSLLSFVIDVVLFGILNPLFAFEGGIAAANVIARVFSASFNYEVNRSAVFNDHTGRRQSFLRYFILAAFILLCNTCILYLLSRAGIKALYAKLMTEACLFVFSFIIQNRYVFNNSQRKAEI